MSLETDALIALSDSQTRETSPIKRFLLFLGSLAAFLLLGLLLVSGSSRLTVWDLLGIVLVLFIHESGHYLSMRWLGYRDVQMFFIPFFGAAVSGYAAPMPIFHQAFVVLAGPIPGICIGFFCLVFFTISGNVVWQKAANWFIALNGLNLIPWYPLDGGRFWDQVISDRYALLKTLFQLSMIGLGFYAYFRWSTPFSYLGMYTLFRIGRYYFANRIAYDLRQQQVENGLSRSDVIPDEIAGATVAKLTEKLPLLSSGKLVAEYVRDIWIRANSERPNKYEIAVMTLTYFAALAIFIIYQFLCLPLLR